MGVDYSRNPVTQAEHDAAVARTAALETTVGDADSGLVKQANDADTAIEDLQGAPLGFKFFLVDPDNDQAYSTIAAGLAAALATQDTTPEGLITFVSDAVDGDEFTITTSLSTKTYRFYDTLPDPVPAGVVAIDLATLVPGMQAMDVMTIVDGAQGNAGDAGINVAGNDDYTGLVITPHLSSTFEISVTAGARLTSEVSADPTGSPTSVVAVVDGAYTEDPTVPTGVHLIGIGQVAISGTLTLSGGTAENVNANTVTGGKVSSLRSGILTALLGSMADNVVEADVGDDDLLRINALGTIKSVDGLNVSGGVFAAGGRAGASLVDHPLPGPFFTNAKAIVVVVCDDVDTNATYGWTGARTGLGGLTPLEYLTAHNVGFTWPVISDKIGTYSMPPTNTLKALLQAVGGELGSHTKTHANDSSPYDQTLGAKAAIEDAFGWPCLSSFHSGPYDPGCSPTLEGGRLTRLGFIAHRSLSTYPPIATLPCPRYPLPCEKPSGVNDTYAVPYFRRMVGSLAASQGLVWMPYIHGVMDSNPPSSEVITSAQLVALVEALETTQDAGDVLIVPAWQASCIYPLYSPNGILNGGFEFADSGGGDNLFEFNFWVTGGAASEYSVPIYLKTSGGNTIALTTTEGEYKNGSQAVKMTKGASGDCILRYNNVPVVPGAQYTLAAWYKMVSGEGTGDLTVTVYFSGGVSWSYTFAKAADWTHARAQVLVPTGNASVRIEIAAPANLATCIDDVFLGIGMPAT